MSRMCHTCGQPAWIDECVACFQRRVHPPMDEVVDDHPEGLAYELGWAALGESFRHDDGCEAASAIGDALVNTAEMRAIKGVLRHHVKEYFLAKQAVGTSASKREILSAWGLPEIVAEWVLS